MKKVRAIVEAMEKAVGCGVSIGRDTCQRGYECQSCGNLRLAAAQLRAVFPELGPSSVPEPKEYTCDVIPADKLVDYLAGKFKP